MKFIDVELRALVDSFGGSLRSFDGKKEQDPLLVEQSLKGIQALDKADCCHLAFLSSMKHREQLLHTRACVVLVRDDAFEDLVQYVLEHRAADTPLPLAWLVPNPYVYYARIQQWWVDRSIPKPQPCVHVSAVIDPSAQVHHSASVGPLVSVGAGCVLGENVRIDAGVVLGRDVRVGNNTRLYPNVTVYDECEIGTDCILHSGCVIGADGFGFAQEHGAWIKIPQVGRVLIADQVEVGANTTIDRGALEDTLIGFGVKLDNQIMVAHNVRIGEHTAMAGCVGVAGSAHIGARCTIGGAAMILGHLNIPDGTHISAASTVMSSIKEPGAYTGIFPLHDHKSWEKTAVSLRQLVKLRTDVRDLKKNN